MKKIAILFAVLLTGCTNANDSRQALAEAGYTDIHVGGYAWLQCGKDDTFATKFRAKGPSGATVNGAVCCGWLKGCTIRH